MKRLKTLRDFLESELSKVLEITINSKQVNRLPHVSNITFNDIHGSQLIRCLKHIAVSQGAACTSNVIKPSHVLTAMGKSEQDSISSLRISIGRYTTISDVEVAIQDLIQAVSTLKIKSS